jgi:putative FmdB family regulatory protein
MTMPLYQFYCDKCQKEVSVTMSISERGRAQATCPGCGSRELRPLLGTFFTQTSKKS